MTDGRIKVLLALGVFGAAFVLYRLTLCPSWFPIDSATTVAMHLGVNPFAPYDHPLWGALLRIWDRLPGGGSAAGMNTLSALFAALACALTYLLTAAIPHDRTSEERISNGPARLAAQVSGLSAALILAISLPFWLVATRAHPLPFNLVLLLLVLFLARYTWQAQRPALYYLCAFVFGIAVAEFPTMAFALPVFYVMGVYGLYLCTRRLEPVPMLGLAACFLLGTSVLLFTALQVWGSPSAEWRGFETFGAALMETLRYQGILLVRVIPKFGWLVIAFTLLVPLIFILWRKEYQRRGLFWGSYLFHGVALLTGCLVLANTAVSPWSLIGFSPVVATPYLMLAIWMGYLCGYGLMLFGGRSPFPHSIQNQVRKPLAALWLTSFIAFVVVCGLRNHARVDGGATRVTGAWAQLMLDQCADRDWLITHRLEDVLRLEARRQGKDLKLINPNLAHSSPYAGFMASRFEDARLKALCRVGLTALMSEWFVKEPSLRDRLAVAGHPDLFHYADLQPVSRGLIYTGAERGAPLDGAALFAAHEAFFEHQLPERSGYADNVISGYLATLDQDLSSSANNLGVLLEEQGYPEFAEQSYHRARSVDPDNVSALLNLVSMSSRREIAGADAIQSAYQTFLQGLEGRLDLWSLSSRYGFVRHPEAYIARGMTWAATARPGLAREAMQQALAMARDDERMQLSFAGIQWSVADREVSAKAFAAMLEQQPDHPDALLGMARVEMLRGDFIAARGRIERLEKLIGNNDTVLLEKVALASFMGEPDQAREIVDGILDKNPRHLKALAGRAFLAAQREDKAVLDDAVKRLLEFPVLPSHIQLALSQLLASRGREVEAIAGLDRLLAMEPYHVAGMEYLLRLEVRRANRSRARGIARELLKLDAGNGYGNEVMGAIEFASGQLSLAEVYFQASVDAVRSSSALNSLAFVMGLDGRYADALPLVEEALRIAPENAAAWDTLCVVQLGLDNLEAAEQAALKALELAPAVPTLRFHLARVYAAQGRKDAARKVLDDLMDHLDEFNASDRRAVRELRRRSDGD